MSKKTEKDAQPEALATFAAAARNKGVKPASQGVSATAHTAGRPSNLEAEERTRPTFSEATRPATKSGWMRQLPITPRPISARDSYSYDDCVRELQGVQASAVLGDRDNTVNSGTLHLGDDADRLRGPWLCRSPGLAPRKRGYPHELDAPGARSGVSLSGRFYGLSDCD